MIFMNTNQLFVYCIKSLFETTAVNAVQLILRKLDLQYIEKENISSWKYQKMNKRRKNFSNVLRQVTNTFHKDET